MKKRLSVVIAALFSSAALFVLSACGNTVSSRTVAAGSEPGAAILTIYAWDGAGKQIPGLVNLGHAFISVRNQTDTPLSMGDYLLQAGEEATVGTWVMSAHAGLWYNLETEYVRQGWYTGRISLSMEISQSGMDSLSELLKQSDSWTPLTNCSAFAASVWNSAAIDENKLSASGLMTPARLASSLKEFYDWEQDRPLSQNPKIGYIKNGSLLIFKSEVPAA